MTEFKKIDKFVYEIGKQDGMQVPARLYIDEKMLEELKEEEKTDWSTVKQLKNVACLQGIQKAAIALSDCHPGYGQCIGGVAAMDMQEGLITFGGIGFDINCLPAEAKVLHRFGYRKKIKDFETEWFDEKIKCVNPSHEVRDTDICNFIVTKPKKVFEIETEANEKLVATSEHPILTPEGMKKLNELMVGDKASVLSFEGVDYEKPSKKIIITEKDFDELKLSNTSKLQILKKLKENKLLPLRLNDPKLPLLIKIMGFALGDASFYFREKKASGISFYGDEEDLHNIRKDIKELGFGCTNIYSRERDHKIKTSYDLVEFRRKETSVRTGSKALCALLLLLGLPSGNKTIKKFEVPKWVLKAKKWQKRLFLAGLFGAELPSPSTVTGHGYNFNIPLLSMNKRIESKESGKKFLLQIKNMLSEFEVKSSFIKEREEYKNEEGDISIRLRLAISSEPKNLIKLWSKIGFEYNKKRSFLANVSVSYLKVKNNVLREREKAIKQIKQLQKKGIKAKQIKEKIKSRYVNERFIERTLWEKRKTDARIAFNFQTFKKYMAYATKGLGQTGQVWQPIVKKKTIEFNKPVYDFTVDDINHNFIANNFVVSNCGVNTFKVPLKKEDIVGKQEELAEELFRKIPAGLGSRGELELDVAEIDEVLAKGAEYVVDNGYGSKEDLEFTELNGKAEGAGAENVSLKAKQRQYKEVGTLGSGNHYLEVQYVEEIFDSEIGKVFGLEEGNVLVSIHCGSRGLGHQIGMDYLKELGEATQKYGIKIKDKELVCAPIQSEEGQKYFSAVNAGTNCAFANRQVLVHLARGVFAGMFGVEEEEMGMVYGVGHNTAKIEKHEVDGVEKELLVHRKGSTRGFGPGREEIPKQYRGVGQPILVGGTMGTASYVLSGTERGMQETFGSAVHGAGRTMSRREATKQFRGESIVEELRKKGIIVKGHGLRGIAEEGPGAYKKIEEVIDVMHASGIAKKVAKVRPLISVKG